MSLKSRLLFASMASFLTVGGAYATDLAGVYNQALKTDPTYKVAEATWLSAKENLPLALVGTGAAGTGLFPNVTVGGLLAKSRIKTSGSSNSKTTYTDKQYTLTVTQPIFNLATWSGIRQAGFGVRSAYAAYVAAGQDLINRVAIAYFEVLRANETLQYTIKEKEADKWELITDLEKYKVGLTAVTGVYNSQASYDSQIATEISDRTTLRDNAENLRVIVGKLYSSFKQLPAKLPAVIPTPASMEAWVKLAAKQSYAIKSARMTMWQNQQAIKTSMAGVAPTLNATGSYEYDDYSAGFATNNPGQKTSTKSGQVGLALNFPLVQGGYVWVNTKQARANYLQASDNLQLTYANTINSTRQSYLSISTGIAEIDADAQSVLANEKNLEATRAAYLVGTRTMVDVLMAIADLYSAKKSWASARYDYIEALFQLKYNAGTLAPKDVATVNSWLQGSVKMKYTQPSYKKDPYYNAANIALLKGYNRPSQSTSSSSKKSKQQKTASRAVVKPAAKPVSKPKAVAVPAKKTVVKPAKKPALPSPALSNSEPQLPMPG
jgi:outer membrane protein